MYSRLLTFIVSSSLFPPLPLGATKEIGTALTRVCLRHKAVESRMKTFTTAIMDCLVVPLQEKLEDWKKQVTVIDKDHAKEYKRCRAELKKRSSDTLRLQKKAKKGAADNLHVLVESSMQDVTMRRCELEEVERKSLRAIMVEERTRYCTFVNMLQPVVHEECEVMSELGHLQVRAGPLEEWLPFTVGMILIGCFLSLSLFVYRKPCS